MLRIAINGYGRIGRCILRAVFEHDLQRKIQIVAINDIADFSLLAHLTQYDSTHGPFQASITQQKNTLIVNQQIIQLLSEPNSAKLPWQSLNIDVVMECSGKTFLRSDAAQHLQAGAKKVLVSHPMEDADKTVVYGVNHQQLTGEHRIISNASCTTNCLAPLAKVLNDSIGIVSGALTTVHAYTNDQHLLDQASSDAYRSRAATLSMIPSKTGAADAIAEVLPELAGKLSGMAIRVPTPNVSLLDFHFVPKQAVSAETINQHLQAAADGALNKILSVNQQPLVSVDFNHHPASCIVDAAQTQVTHGQAKVMAWYDNEWGFSNRMLDVALHLNTLN